MAARFPQPWFDDDTRPLEYEVTGAQSYNSRMDHLSSFCVALGSLPSSEERKNLGNPEPKGVAQRHTACLEA